LARDWTEGASVPKTDDPKPGDPKPDEPQGVKGADAGLTHAYEGIKSAQEELARLDRLVSGMERGDRPSIRQSGTGAEPSGATVSEAPPPPRKRLENKVLPPGARRGRAMLALVGFLLAIGIFGAAFASRYGNPAKAIMARWAPPVSIAHEEAREPPDPPKTLMAQAATDTPQPPSPPAAPSQKETKDVPSTGATASADRTSADLAQSLKTITQDLASINQKLDQLKSSYDQKLREQADALQQLKTTQQQDARDKERIGAQIQAMQAQLAALSAKPAAQSPKKENDVAAPQRQSVFVPPRPRRPPAPWRPRRYMDEPYYDDPYW
jgi:hypothetical protein